VSVHDSARATGSPVAASSAMRVAERTLRAVMVPASRLLPEARRILADQRRRIESLVPDGELVLTGGTSLAAALTGGDIDLHLRVPADAFDRAVDALRTAYDIVRPEIWAAASLATFVDRIDPRIGVAVTPIGSEHDRRFVRTWDRLRRDPAALEAYNAMKRAHSAGGAARYEREKSAFFDRLTAGDG
jgi:hypothetical protein